MTTTRRTRLSTLAVGSLLTVSLAACGSNAAGSASSADGASDSSSAASSSASSTAPAEGVVGQPFDADLGDGVASITIEKATYSTKPIPGQIADADNGGYLVLDVTWETKERTTSPNPLYWTAKDAKGNPHAASLLTQGQLNGRDLAVGQKATGKMAFDVPRGKTVIRIVDASQQKVAQATVTP